jgi:hypothetical protein
MTLSMMAGSLNRFLCASRSCKSERALVCEVTTTRTGAAETRLERGQDEQRGPLPA